MSSPLSTATDFRVIYLGNQEWCEKHRNDFVRAGALNDPLYANCFHIGQRLLSVSNRVGLKSSQFSQTTVFFFSDIHDFAQSISKIDADLVVLDERNADGNDFGELSLEKVLQSLETMTPRWFHYPTRRILVICPKTFTSNQRVFNLGLANVRAAIMAPHSTFDLFRQAGEQLSQFRRNKNKNSMCISGGGLEGYLYSVGVAHALNDCFVKKSTNDFDIFCGVSSGSILAASLALDIKISELVDQLHRKEGRLEPFRVMTVFDLATKEITQRVFDFIKSLGRKDTEEVVGKLQSLVPTGFFRGDKLRSFLQRQFENIGIRDHFSAIKKELFISTTDLDSGEHIVMGEEPWRDVKISQAIRASCALPPFFLPERIHGHWFTDGQLTSSSDYNTAIEKGAGLVVLIDPMVAFTSEIAGLAMKYGGYFITVQAIKSLIQTRAESMLKHAMDLNPDVDFIVFQPSDQVMATMAGNPMRHRIRTELVTHSYYGTIQQILERYSLMEHRFKKHGFVLKSENEIRMLAVQP